MEVESCKHCGGKLIVYTSRLKKSHRVQYLRCKQCGRPASKKQIQHDMLERLSTLECRVDSVELQENAAGATTQSIAMPQFTYFIGAICSVGEEVKIGKTSNLKKRLATLQCANHRQLIVHGVILSDVEADLHIQFSDSRTRSEWFIIDESMERLIRENANNVELAMGYRAPKKGKHDVVFQEDACSSICTDCGGPALAYKTRKHLQYRKCHKCGKNSKRKVVLKSELLFW